MTSSQNLPAKAKGTAYQVERPRISDAVGSALHQAYAGTVDVPEEMARLLHVLGRHAWTRTH
ncbi:hypothetical protein LQ953_15920 [Sphingomonas sp. IC-56]|nr:hypothetical protein [Sphingomonas sp. IC-56]